MISLVAKAPFIQFPGISAKWVIGSLALFHTAVASLAIGFAFIVTVLQIIGYKKKIAGYDLLAKRVQLWHVCIYNIGTINAIGLVFALSGLYPQFWSQLFVGFFWPMIMEEVIFFLLATTLTLHYFFWDYLIENKRLHIFLGALMTPLFLLQFYLINGMAGFMLTPGAAKGTVSQWSGTAGILGYDKATFYNPTFLMLTFHRASANVSYAGFVVAGICGILLYRARREKIAAFYETGGRMAFKIAFIFLLSLPIIGFFYAWVLKYWAVEAYNNLMYGRGDIVAGGIDWWWVKHVIVVAMIGIGLAFFWDRARAKDKLDSEAGGMIRVMVWVIAVAFFVFYAGMGMQMTWTFFWGMLAATLLAVLLGAHLLKYHGGSARGMFVLMAILSFLTVLLGGYAREASRPRFVDPNGEDTPGMNRISHYDAVYVDAERQKHLSLDMKLEYPAYLADLPGAQPSMTAPAVQAVPEMIDLYCTGCHTLERMRTYPRNDWARVVRRMKVYNVKLSTEEEERIVQYLKDGKPY